MRRSKALNRLRAGKPVRMAVMGHYIPYFVRLAAHQGFDCIWLDQEHRAMDSRELQSLLTVFHLANIDCMLRPPTLEKSRLYRYLEDGATGLMIPLVSTEEKARQLVDAVKFPPLGGRGLDGSGLDADYGLEGGETYPDAANRETFLVVQIETPEAVANAERIAAVEGIDGLFIGPADLGLRLKQGGNSSELQTAVARVAAAAAKHGKAWGQPAMSPEHLRQLIDQGAQLAAFGSEYAAIKSMLDERFQQWQEILGE